MTHIPVCHPYGVASRSNVALNSASCLAKSPASAIPGFGYFRLTLPICRTGGFEPTPSPQKQRAQKGPIDFWRRGWDSNPRRATNPCWFSRPVHSTALPPLLILSMASVLRARIVVAVRFKFNNLRNLSTNDRAGLMTHIPVRHPYGVASRSQIAPGDLVKPFIRFHLPTNIQ